MRKIYINLLFLSILPLMTDKLFLAINGNPSVYIYIYVRPLRIKIFNIEKCGGGTVVRERSHQVCQRYTLLID